MHIFADESGKFHSAPVVAFAGFVGSVDQWQVFNAGWESIMQKEHITSIHTSKLMSSPGAYQGRRFSSSQKYDLLQKCLALANTHAFMALGSAVDSVAFKRLSKHSKDKVGKDGHVMAFMAFLHQLVESFEIAAANHLIGRQPIALVFDDNREYAAKCYRIFSLRRQGNPTWRNWLKSICFADDEANTPIQAADILAWTLNQHLKLARNSSDSSLSKAQIETLINSATDGLGGGALEYDAHALRNLDKELKTRDFYETVKIELKNNGNLCT